MSAFVYVIVMRNNKRVCIFVDGENLRHSIGNLFPNFNRSDYLPVADWGNFFDWIAHEVAGPDAERIRTYWYVVQNVDFAPYNLNSVRKNEVLLEKLLSKDKDMTQRIMRTPQEQKSECMEIMANELQEGQHIIEKRFAGWASIQNEIARKYDAIEFRRAGSIRYDLFRRALGSEKAVDIKLATDLIKLKDMYDVAVVMSGDQDYVPAVEAIKDLGKHTVNVAFLTEGDRLLPGGAKRLNQSTDWSIEVKHMDSKQHFNLG